jgi:hypothetical protein
LGFKVGQVRSQPASEIIVGRKLFQASAPGDLLAQFLQSSIIPEHTGDFS